MSGNTGEVCHRQHPSQTLALEVEINQVLVCEDQGLVVLVLQVVQHSVCSIAALVHVGKGVLPSAEVAHIPCTTQLLKDSSKHVLHQQNPKLATLPSPVAGTHTYVPEFVVDAVIIHTWLPQSTPPRT